MTSEKVSPLTQSVYNHLPKTMQSLSLMGKTVIVTGYVIIADMKEDKFLTKFTVVPVVLETPSLRHALRPVPAMWSSSMPTRSSATSLLLNFTSRLATPSPLTSSRLMSVMLALSRVA